MQDTTLRENGRMSKLYFAKIVADITKKFHLEVGLRYVNSPLLEERLQLQLKKVMTRGMTSSNF